MSDRSTSEQQTILVVDDNITNRSLISRILKDDYNLLEANSGEMALDILHDSKVDLIITDQRMGGISGDELLTQVGNRIPSIMVTANEAELKTGIDVVTGRKINLSKDTDVLFKPIDVTALQNAVRKALQRQ